jgi:hypothetical protein
MDTLDWITALLAIAAGVLSLFFPLVPYDSNDSTTQSNAKESSDG